MAIYIDDPETEAVVQKLASIWGVSLTEAVKRAVLDALEREKSKMPLQERIMHLQATGAEHLSLFTDKTFVDPLNNEED